MKHRIVIVEKVRDVGEVLGLAKIRQDGTLILYKSTKEAIENCCGIDNNISNSTWVLYRGTGKSLRFSSKLSYDIFETNLVKKLNMYKSIDKNVHRYLTKYFSCDGDIDNIIISESFMIHLELDFGHSNKWFKNVLISYKGKEEDTEKDGDYYSIVNPLITKGLIFLSDSLMSEIGRKLIKDAIRYIDKNTADKLILIIFNRKKDSDKEYENAFIKGCKYLGFKSENIILSDDIEYDDILREIIMITDYIYVPDGNVYDTLAYMNRRNIKRAIHIAVTNNTKKSVYIGSSAGAAVAGKDISLIDYGEFDKNEVGLSSEEFGGLGLFEGTIIPHYDKDEYLENLKESAIKDGKEKMLKNYMIIERVGNEETLII